MKYIVQKAVKKYVNDQNKQISSEALAVLDRLVEEKLTAAVERCGGFKRVRPYDIGGTL